MNRITKLKQKETTIFILPAYNEEKNIERTITSWIPIVKKHPGSEILVLNDGSVDKTATILNKLSKKYNFFKVINKKNEGHGKTILLGYKKAIQTKHAWVFQTDSDGHFETKDFYKLWKKRKNSNFIIGARLNRQDPLYRLLYSHFISIWIFLLFGKCIKDPNIPFRLIERNYLKKIIRLVPNEAFAPNILLSILAVKDGFNLHHIPVKHFARNKDSYPKLKMFKGAFRGFADLLVFALSA